MINEKILFSVVDGKLDTICSQKVYSQFFYSVGLIKLVVSDFDSYVIWFDIVYTDYLRNWCTLDYWHWHEEEYVLHIK